jgi:hypothetical protein
MRPRIAIERISSSIESAPAEYTGLVIRDEIVYKSTAAGQVNFSVAENEHVHKGIQVCSIYDAQEVSRIENELLSVNEQLLKLQEMRDGLNDLDGNISRINTQMRAKVNNQLGQAMSNNFSWLRSLKTGLETSVELRNEILLSDNTGVLSAEASKREMYESELSRHKTVIAANESGIVSTVLDGYEESYTFSLMDKLSKEQTTINVEHILPVKQAATEQPLFKVVNSYIWYIAAYLPNEQLTDWKAGDEVILATAPYNSSDSLPAVIEKIDTIEKESYVLFRCTKYLEKYLGARSIQFRLESSPNTGFRIPFSAVVKKQVLRIPKIYIKTQENGNSGVLYLSGGAEQVVKAVKFEEFAVCVEPIDGIVQVGTEIRKPDEFVGEEPVSIKIAESISIEGIYRVNRGIAEFRPITIEEQQGKTDYFFINPSLNRTIQEMDSYVLDASKVEENQIIY